MVEQAHTSILLEWSWVLGCAGRIGTLPWDEPFEWECPVFAMLD